MNSEFVINVYTEVHFHAKTRTEAKEWAKYMAGTGMILPSYWKAKIMKELK